MKKDYFRLLICSTHALVILLIAVILLSLTSCKTKKVVEYREVPVVTEKVSHDTLMQYRDRTCLDTIWQKDSIVLRSDGGKDTWHTLYRTKIERATDTIYRTSHEVIPKVVTVTKKETVKESLSAKDKWKYGFGFLAAGFLIGAIGVLVSVWKVGK